MYESKHLTSLSSSFPPEVFCVSMSCIDTLLTCLLDFRLLFSSGTGWMMFVSIWMPSFDSFCDVLRFFFTLAGFWLKFSCCFDFRLSFCCTDCTDCLDAWIEISVFAEKSSLTFFSGRFLTRTGCHLFLLSFFWRLSFLLWGWDDLHDLFCLVIILGWRIRHP